MFCVPPLHAQSSEDGLRLSQRYAATGARMAGIGTMGYGGFGDYTALVGNPAGLGLVHGSSLTGTFQGFEVGENATSSTRGFDSRETEHASDYTGIGNVGTVYKVPTTQGSLVFGLAYNEVAHYGRDLRFGGVNSMTSISTAFVPFASEYRLGEDGSFDPDDLADFVYPAYWGGFFDFYEDGACYDDNPFCEAVVPGTSIAQNGRVEEEGYMSELSLGGSIEASRGLWVGASINFNFGRYDFDSLLEEDDFNNENTAEDYSVFVGIDTYFEGFSRLEYEQRISSDLVGFNLRVGISASVNDNVRVGLTYQSPTYTTIEESYGASYYTYFDDNNSLGYGSSAGDVGSGVFDYTLVSPARISAGIVVELGDVSILADAQRVNYGSMRFSADEDRIFDNLNDQIGEDYGVVYNLSGGFEADIGKFSLRGGAAWLPDPLTFTIQNSSGGSLNRDRRIFSGGVGYRFNSKFQMDLAYQYESYDSGYLPYPTDAFGSRYDDNVPVLHIDETVTRDRVVLGATYRF